MALKMGQAQKCGGAKLMYICKHSVCCNIGHNRLNIFAHKY
jgi:hypothetical protein